MASVPQTEATSRFLAICSGEPATRDGQWLMDTRRESWSRAPHLETLQGHVGLLVEIQVEGGQAQLAAVHEVHAPNLAVAGAAVARGAHHQVPEPVLVEVSRGHCPVGKKREHPVQCLRRAMGETVACFSLQNSLLLLFSPCVAVENIHF